MSGETDTIENLRAERDEARSWARHGYEIGQRSLLWSDYGVAPKWLTEGWPKHFETEPRVKLIADLEGLIAHYPARKGEADVADTQLADIRAELLAALETEDPRMGMVGTVELARRVRRLIDLWR